jgi:hypothetical protein
MNNYEEYYDEDVPKRRKKKNNASKSKARSDHKHVYKRCVLMRKFFGDQEEPFPCLANYCVKCGKLKEELLTEMMCRIEGGYRPLTCEEAREKFKNLPVFTVEEFQNYVTTEVGNGGL